MDFATPVFEVRNDAPVGVRCGRSAPSCRASRWLPGTTIAFGAASLVQGSPPPLRRSAVTTTGRAPADGRLGLRRQLDRRGAGRHRRQCLHRRRRGGPPPPMGRSLSGSSTPVGRQQPRHRHRPTAGTTANLSVSAGLQNDGALTVGADHATSDQPGLVLDGAITNTGTITVDGLLALGGTAPSETSGLANDGTLGVAPGGQIVMAGASSITNEPDGVLAFGIEGPSSSSRTTGASRTARSPSEGPRTPSTRTGSRRHRTPSISSTPGHPLERSPPFCTPPRPTTPTPVRWA